jgi:hypothetical protein
MVYEGYDFEDYGILFNFYILLTILHLKMVTYFYSIWTLLISNSKYYIINITYYYSKF